MDPKTIKPNKDNDLKYLNSYQKKNNDEDEAIKESTDTEELEYFTE